MNESAERKRTKAEEGEGERDRARGKEENRNENKRVKNSLRGRFVILSHTMSAQRTQRQSTQRPNVYKKRNMHSQRIVEILLQIPRL